MSQYKIIADENIPRGMEALYAIEAVKSAEARRKSADEAHRARSDHEQQVKESVAHFEREATKREEAEKEARRERDRARFERDLRLSFLNANPGADESDWKRNRQSVVDDAMRARVSRQAADRETERVIDRVRNAI